MMRSFLSLGTGPGIGLSTARRFAAEGYRVVLASRYAEKIEALADDLRRGPNAGVAVATVDCADVLGVAALVDRYAADLEVLHYNAAVIRAEGLRDQSVESIAGDLQVNVAGALAAAKRATEAMAGRRRGTILLTGGGLGVTPSARLLTLSVGKAALRCAARALFPELEALGIHIAVLTIASGIVPASKDAEAVGEAFWRLHAQPPGEWTWEAWYD